MKSGHFVRLAFTAAAMLLTTTVQAGLLDKFNPIKAVVNVVTAPAKTVINAVNVVVNGANPSTILDPTKDAARSIAPLCGKTPVGQINGSRRIVRTDSPYSTASTTRINSSP